LGVLLLKKRKNRKAYHRDIEKKKKKHQGNDEILSLLDFMMKKPDIYREANVKKIHLLRKEFKKTNSDFLFINNPEARLMKTKNNDWNACINVQLSCNTNHIILAPMISQKTSDNQVFSDLMDNFSEIILSLYAAENNDNPEEILKNFISLVDNGYATDEAFEYAETHELDVIFDTRLKSIKTEETYFLKDEKIIELENIGSKKHLKYNSEKDTYVCFKNKEFTLDEIKNINTKFNQRNIPEEFKKLNYQYKNTYCAKCSLKKECANNKDFKIINDRISPLNKKARQKRHENGNESIYKYRWKTIESIFGYLKGADGVLRFVSRTLENIEKELYFYTITYNLKRIVKLKGTPY
jgi:hypothetical protein